jgi:alginate O-acetyltransferase complex protein AlgI
MLFNSPAFIFLFLPIVTLGFFIFGLKVSRKGAIVWLVAASLFFYGWWNPMYVSLLLLSITCNYIFGIYISRTVPMNPKRGRLLVTVAILANLVLLAYYKYYNFFSDSINQLTGADLPITSIALPLGISFFTFTQIAFLVDTYQRKVREQSFYHYLLFVTYFPHLIAGPVLHHKEMMPQFSSSHVFQFRPHRMIVGLTIFFLGLFKKIVVADSLAPYANTVFVGATLEDASVSFFAAWGGAIAYALQLYYDFSGYSDMAVGLSLLFGIRLPLNFFSPYKAVDIIDFWRRWHMTLSRFLRDYLYIPLGGNRHGIIRRYANLMITMLLGGLWHGAGWTFVIWGILHGFYLMVNHAWRSFRAVTTPRLRSYLYIHPSIATLLTFLAVTVAWVFFRADNIKAAVHIISGMTGLNGFIFPNWLLPLSNQIGLLESQLQGIGVKFTVDPYFDQWGYLLILVVLAFTWVAPNTYQFMARFKPTLNVFEADKPSHNVIQWRFNRISATYVALVTFMAIIGLNRVSEFLYFQF